MRLKLKSSLGASPLLLLLFVVAGWVGVPGSVSAATDAKVEAILVWGTDDAAPSTKSLKQLESKLHDKLARVFKWQNYFEVNRKNAQLSSGKLQGLKLSNECSVEMKMLPGNFVEAKLLSKGKALVTRRHSLAKAEALVLAGDDRNKNAWFVVLNFN